MPGLIRRSDIDEVRSRINIADIVGDYVTLKSAGVGSLKGLCPFHEERSPSFHVRPGVGRYHCFGCGEDGDVFTFLQRMDHVSFQEAVERMAGRAGVELHYEDGSGPAADHGQRARLLAANAAAEQFFRTRLGEPDAQPARDFLGGRGFDQAAAERFGVGYAPKSFDALKNALSRQGFTEQELVAAGLLSTGERGNSYDRFRGRVIWPIRDVTGQTVGFGARKLFDDDQGPKYLNTPETLVFHKSQVLYGLDLARRDVAKGKQVVIVEGYTDVMACHLAGVTTAVATCGTAFGVDHIKVVRRVLGDVQNSDASSTGEVIFTFDPDDAGQRAASRAFAEEQRFAAQTFVAVAPDGLDPCDLRIHRGDDAVRQLVASRKPMFEFMIRRRLAEHDLETVEGRVAALRAAAPVVAGIRDRSLSVGYVRSLAGWLGMDPAEVGRAVTSAANVARRSEPRSEHREAPAGEGDAQPTPREARLVDLPTDPVTRMERDALMAILQYPNEVGPALVAKAAETRFANSTLAVVKDAVRANLDHLADGSWLQRVADEVPPGFSTLVSQLGIAPIPERREQVAIYCVGVVTSLVDRDLLRRKGEILGAMQRARADGDREREAALSRESAALESERRELRGE
ncbi:DNA primase [Homoserinibacter sp. GY 40078]|uniref:DNA primase n=1 Tax=Homoserinibacter sp. GY 40078 TaxID=2603275 RepID=UPI0011CC519F|nr:DNA primase [Homoserinibacter sp. GY 40078]TXK17366.1 DNA primase [Homoserinibacter sp. GY 40078]